MKASQARARGLHRRDRPRDLTGAIDATRAGVYMTDHYTTLTSPHDASMPRLLAAHLAVHEAAS